MPDTVFVYMDESNVSESREEQDVQYSNKSDELDCQ